MDPLTVWCDENKRYVATLRSLSSQGGAGGAGEGKTGEGKTADGGSGDGKRRPSVSRALPRKKGGRGSITGGIKLLTQNGEEVSATGALSGKYVGVLFGASWSPPCAKFTLWLATAYEALLKAGHEVEVVFASGDVNEMGYMESRSRMPWLSLPFKDRRIGHLRRRFRVRDIPALIWLDSEGNIVTHEGTAVVHHDVMGSDFPWRPPPLWDVLDESTPLFRRGGVATTAGEEKLHDSTVIGLYFSAGWCGTCAMVTPIVRDAHASVSAREGDNSFSVLYVSSDRSDVEYEEQLGTMNWAALARDDRRTKILMSKFRVEALPTLVLVEVATGHILSSSGVGLLEDDPDGDGFPWRVRELSHSGGADVDYLPALVLLLDGVPLSLMTTPQRGALVDEMRSVADALTKRLGESGEEREDNPMVFLWGDESHPLTKTVRRAAGLEKAGAPVLVMLDIAEQVSCRWEPEEGKPVVPTREDMLSFANDFLEHKLTMTPFDPDH